MDDFLASRLAKLGNALGRARASKVSSDARIRRRARSRLPRRILRRADAFGKLFADVDGAPPLVRFTKDAFGEYFALIREKCVSEEEEEEGKEEARDERVLLDPRRLMSAMGAMAADLASAHRAVPEASLGDRAVETIERAVRGRTDAAFVRLERALVREIDATREEARRLRAFGGGGDDGDGSTNKSLYSASSPPRTRYSRAYRPYSRTFAPSWTNGRYYSPDGETNSRSRFEDAF